MSRDEAARELASGKIVASISVPPGFLNQLVTTVQSPKLVLRTASGGLAPRVTQQMQALVYQLNRKLQAGFIAANLALREPDPARRQRELHRQAFRRAGSRQHGEGAERIAAERARRADSPLHADRTAGTRADRQRAAGDREPDRALAAEVEGAVVGALRAGAGIRHRAHRHLPLAAARRRRDRRGARRGNDRPAAPRARLARPARLGEGRARRRRRARPRRGARTRVRRRRRGRAA